MIEGGDRGKHRRQSNSVCNFLKETKDDIKVILVPTWYNLHVLHKRFKITEVNWLGEREVGYGLRISIAVKRHRAKHREETT